MRIEVLVGSEDPIIYPLKSSKIVIGSAESSDVVLSAEGISRKHLIIAIEGDAFYVIDQGSTNGSFINEERLVPGKRVEFTSFFPVRLGDNVLISLLGDEDGVVEKIDFNAKTKEKTSSSINIQAPRNEDSTQVYNLSRLNAAKTSTLVKKREEKRTEQKKISGTKAKKEKEPRSAMPLIGMAILGFAIYYNFFVMKRETPTDVPEAKVGEEVRVKKVISPTKESSLLIEDSLLTTREKFSSLLNDIKCTNDQEKYLCGIIPGANQGQFGVTQVGTTLNIMIDAGGLYEEAVRYVAPISQSGISQQDYDKEIEKVAVYLLLVKMMPEELNQEMLKDYRLNFAIFSNGEIKTVFALKPQAYAELRSKFNLSNLTFVREAGIQALNFTEKYYKIY